MKKFNLLLATTAILSTGALIANATELGVKINAQVAMFPDFSMNEVQELSFGTIIGPVENQLVVVTPSGALGSGTTAKVTDTKVKEGGKTVNYTIHAGKIEVIAADPQIEGVLPSVDLILPKNIVLKDGSNTCGEVTEVSASEYSMEDGGFTYGGTFKVGDISSATLFCTGSETITAVWSFDKD